MSWLPMALDEPGGPGGPLPGSSASKWCRSRCWLRLNRCSRVTVLRQAGPRKPPSLSTLVVNAYAHRGAPQECKVL